MRVPPEHSIAANQAAQITGAIVLIVLGRGCKCAGAHELVAIREVWSTAGTALRPGDEFPAALGQETVVRTGNQLGTVLKADPPGRLDHTPVSENPCPHVAPVPARPHGTVDRVSDPNIRDRPRRAVRHQDRRAAMQAVHAPVLASPVRVDRLFERNVWRVVAGDDRARSLRTHLGRDRRRHFVAIPTIVHRLNSRLQEPRLRISGCPSPFVHRHDGYCICIQYPGKWL